MNSRLLAVAACLLSLAAANVPRGGGSERSRAEVYTLEGLGALPGVAGCGCLAAGTGFIGFAALFSHLYTDDPNPEVSSIAMAAVCAAAVSAAVLPAAAAYGTTKVGHELGEAGADGLAYGGAYAGALVGTGLVWLGAILGGRTSDAVGVPFYLLGGAAIPVGAVVGYNLGAPSRSHVGSRFQLPALALIDTRLPDRSVEHGVKVQLAGLKF